MADTDTMRKKHKKQSLPCTNATPLGLGELTLAWIGADVLKVLAGASLADLVFAPSLSGDGDDSADGCKRVSSDPLVVHERNAAAHLKLQCPVAALAELEVALCLCEKHRLGPLPELLRRWEQLAASGVSWSLDLLADVATLPDRSGTKLLAEAFEMLALVEMVTRKDVATNFNAADSTSRLFLRAMAHAGLGLYYRARRKPRVAVQYLQEAANGHARWVHPAVMLNLSSGLATMQDFPGSLSALNLAVLSIRSAAGLLKSVKCLEKVVEAANLAVVAALAGKMHDGDEEPTFSFIEGESREMCSSSQSHNRPLSANSGKSNRPSSANSFKSRSSAKSRESSMGSRARRSNLHGYDTQSSLHSASNADPWNCHRNDRPTSANSCKSNSSAQANESRGHSSNDWPCNSYGPDRQVSGSSRKSEETNFRRSEDSSTHLHRHDRPWSANSCKSDGSVRGNMSDSPGSENRSSNFCGHGRQVSGSKSSVESEETIAHRSQGSSRNAHNDLRKSGDSAKGSTSDGFGSESCSSNVHRHTWSKSSSKSEEASVLGSLSVARYSGGRHHRPSSAISSKSKGSGKNSESSGPGRGASRILPGDILSVNSSGSSIGNGRPWSGSSLGSKISVQSNASNFVRNILARSGFPQSLHRQDEQVSGTPLCSGEGNERSSSAISWKSKDGNGLPSEDAQSNLDRQESENSCKNEFSSAFKGSVSHVHSERPKSSEAPNPQRHDRPTSATSCKSNSSAQANESRGHSSNDWPCNSYGPDRQVSGSSRKSEETNFHRSEDSSTHLQRHDRPSSANSRGSSRSVKSDGNNSNSGEDARMDFQDHDGQMNVSMRFEENEEINGCGYQSSDCGRVRPSSGNSCRSSRSAEGHASSGFGSEGFQSNFSDCDQELREKSGEGTGCSVDTASPLIGPGMQSMDCSDNTLNRRLNRLNRPSSASRHRGQRAITENAGNRFRSEDAPTNFHACTSEVSETGRSSRSARSGEEALTNVGGFRSGSSRQYDRPSSANSCISNGSGKGDVSRLSISEDRPSNFHGREDCQFTPQEHNPVVAGSESSIFGSEGGPSNSDCHDRQASGSKSSAKSEEPSSCGSQGRGSSYNRDRLWSAGGYKSKVSEKSDDSIASPYFGNDNEDVENNPGSVTTSSVMTHGDYECDERNFTLGGIPALQKQDGAHSDQSEGSCRSRGRPQSAQLRGSPLVEVEGGSMGSVWTSGLECFEGAAENGHSWGNFSNIRQDGVLHESSSQSKASIIERPGSSQGTATTPGLSGRRPPTYKSVWKSHGPAKHAATLGVGSSRRAARMSQFAYASEVAVVRTLLTAKALLFPWPEFCEVAHFGQDDVVFGGAPPPLLAKHAMNLSKAWPLWGRAQRMSEAPGGGLVLREGLLLCFLNAVAIFRSLGEACVPIIHEGISLAVVLFGTQHPLALHLVKAHRKVSKQTNSVSRKQAERNALEKLWFEEAVERRIFFEEEIDRVRRFLEEEQQERHSYIEEARSQRLRDEGEIRQLQEANAMAAKAAKQRWDANGVQSTRQELQMSGIRVRRIRELEQSLQDLEETVQEWLIESQGREEKLLENGRQLERQRESEQNDYWRRVQGISQQQEEDGSKNLDQAVTAMHHRRPRSGRPRDARGEVPGTACKYVPGSDRKRPPFLPVPHAVGRRHIGDILGESESNDPVHEDITTTTESYPPASEENIFPSEVDVSTEGFCEARSVEALSTDPSNQHKRPRHRRGTPSSHSTSISVSSHTEDFFADLRKEMRQLIGNPHADGGQPAKRGSAQRPPSASWASSLPNSGGRTFGRADGPPPRPAKVKESIHDSLWQQLQCQPPPKDSKKPVVLPSTVGNSEPRKPGRPSDVARERTPGDQRRRSSLTIKERPQAVASLAPRSMPKLQSSVLEKQWRLHKEASGKPCSD